MEFSVFDFSIGVLVALAGLGAFVLSRSYFRVDEGHAAVLTRFGKVLRHGDAMKVFQAGIHRKKPWDRAITFSTMERVIDLTGEEGGQLAMASDGTVIRLDSRIRFFPKQDQFYNYLFGVNNPMSHIRDMFSCILRNEIANFESGGDRDDSLLGAFYSIRRNRERLNLKVDAACASRLEKSSGVQFCGVDLTDIVPPHELESALNGIHTARTEAATLFAKAEADSRQKIAAAKENVEIARMRAESTVTELLTLSQQIDKSTRQGMIENYLNHRKTELLGDSKMLFLQKEI